MPCLTISNVIPLEEAQQQILAALPVPAIERVGLADWSGRILAENVLAAVDLPSFDNSAMDGYAVRAADVAGAGSANPVRLHLAGRTPAGGVFSGELLSGQCVRLFTGSVLPRGADAVVMQEDVRTEASHPDEVLICDTASPGENIRRAGEDVRRGEIISRAGEALTPGRIALLAAAGVSEIAVGKRPVVGLIATGSELREAGQTLGPGQIYESNRATIAPLIVRAGGVARILPVVSDTLAATQTALEIAFDDCDIVVTSGGVSVGELDFVKAAFENLGGDLQFWKVAIRPGKPFVSGRLGKKFLFGLPGNPVSAFVTFLLLVRPALLRWQGATDFALPSYPGVLAEVLGNRGDRRHFARVRADAEGQVFSAGRQASHALSSLAAANGLVDLAPGERLPVGTTVKVLSLA